MQAIVETSTGIVQAFGEFPTLPADPDLEVIEVTPEMEAVWFNPDGSPKPGTKRIDENGDAVLDPPPPPRQVYVERLPLSTEKALTTDATPVQIWSYLVPVQSVVVMHVDLTAVDTGSGVSYHHEATVTFKRVAGPPVRVGTISISPGFPQRDAAASAWDVTIGSAGNEVWIEVTGAADRVIDWTLDGSMKRFSPHGFDSPI